MASRGSGTKKTTTAAAATTTPSASSPSTSDSEEDHHNHINNRASSTTHESFLSRKKKELVDRSMELFQRKLNECLDGSVSAAAVSAATSSSSSAPGAGGGGEEIIAKRRAKRAREETYEAELGSGGLGGRRRTGGGGTGRTAGKAEVDTGGGAGGCGGKASKKKRVSNGREGGERVAKRFACPFCKHDPVKYRNERTCCGPGWEDVHRVKEHVYRRHSLKNLCPRCFEHFDKPESLKNHQRADVPCKVRDKGPEVISDEQERRLRARAKSNCTEEAKWEEMYGIIFPGEKVPTPYYDPATDGSLNAESSRFRSLDECREFLRDEIPKLVRPAMERYVNTLFEEVQQKVNQKTLEIIREVETKVLLNFRFQEEQQNLSLAAALPPPVGAAVAPQVAAVAAAAGGGVEPGEPGPELSKVSQMLEGLRDDAHYHELCNSLQFDVEDLLSNQQGYGYDNYSLDSAYYTSSSTGHGPIGDDYYRSY